MNDNQFEKLVACTRYIAAISFEEHKPDVADNVVSRVATGLFNPESNLSGEAKEMELKFIAAVMLPLSKVAEAEIVLGGNESKTSAPVAVESETADALEEVHVPATLPEPEDMLKQLLTGFVNADKRSLQKNSSPIRKLMDEAEALIKSAKRLVFETDDVNIAERKKMLESATKCALESLKLDNELGSTHFLYGQCQLWSDDLIGAEASFNSAIEKMPTLCKAINDELFQYQTVKEELKEPFEMITEAQSRLREKARLSFGDLAPAKE